MPDFMILTCSYIIKYNCLRACLKSTEPGIKNIVFSIQKKNIYSIFVDHRGNFVQI